MPDEFQVKWLEHFVETIGELRKFLGTLSEEQVLWAKVFPSKKAGYAIYGFSIVFPE